MAQTGPASTPTVSLSIVAGNKKHLSPQDLKAAGFAVRDGAVSLDPGGVQLSENEGTPLLTVVFGGLSPSDTRRAVDVARRVLKVTSEPAIPAAVLQVGAQLQLIQGFTADRAVLDAALHLLAKGDRQAVAGEAAAQARQLGERVAQGGSGVQRDLVMAMSRGLNGAPELATGQRIPLGIATLMAAASAQREIQGRKAIVYFTAEGLSGADTSGMLRALYERLADASVSLYVVDVRGTDHNADQAMLAATVVGAQSAGIRDAVAAAPKPRPGTSPNAPTEKTLNLTPAEFRQMNDTISNIEAGNIGLSSQSPLSAVAFATGGRAADAEEAEHSFGRRIEAELTR